jgi:predicted nucleic acid-binding protein
VSRVFWDTNRGDELLTSTLTLGEVLVKPAEAKDTRLKAAYEDAIARSATVLPFTRAVARLYAEIRRDRSIRPRWPTP